MRGLICEVINYCASSFCMNEIGIYDKIVITKPKKERWK